MNPNKVGKTILFLRKHYNMTQHELAEKLGVTDKAVSRWENGYGTPDISLLSKLSIILDVDIESILEGNLSNLDYVWKGILYLDYPKGVSPLDYIYDIRIVELQLSMFLLAGIQEVCISGSKEIINQVRQLIGDGSQYGCYFKYQAEDDFTARHLDNIVEESNKTDCIMLITGSTFVYGKDITKCFRRIINDNGTNTRVYSHYGKDCKISFYKKGMYEQRGKLDSFTLDRGVIAFELSDRQSILDASNLLVILNRQMDEKVADLLEIADRRGYIKLEKND